MSEVAKINTPATRRSKLGIAPEQEAFTRDQVAALKKMNGWRDVPDAELSVFFHQAQRTGLDPFAKQVYLIGRYSRKNDRMDWTIQTSIDGMRLVAGRTNRYAGSDRPRFGEEDGDRYAEVTVWKLVGDPAMRVAFTGVAFESEFKDDRSPMWKKMPKTMLSKCAESVALRKAFPADLSGIYGQEEMDQAGPPVAAAQPESVVVEAEVVDQRQREPESQGETAESVREQDHRIVVSEIEDMLDKAPDGFFKNATVMAEYARESYEKSLVVRKKMQRLLEEGKPSETNESGGSFGNTLSEEEQREIEDSVDDGESESADSTGGAESRPNKNDLPATRKQLNYLESLAADVEDGVAKFEERAGKRIAELTREEASEWIGSLGGKAAE